MEVRVQNFERKRRQPSHGQIILHVRTYTRIRDEKQFALENQLPV